MVENGFAGGWLREARDHVKIAVRRSLRGRAADVRQVIDAYFDHLNAERYDELAALFAPDAELLAPGAGVRRGREAIGRYFRQALAPYPDHLDEPARVLLAGDTATVEIHFRGALANGVPLEFDAVDVFDFDGGAIVRLTSWYDSHEVRRTLARALAADGPALDPGDGPPRLGAISEVTSARRLAALQLVRRGVAFRLDLPLTQPETPLFGRSAPDHAVWSLPGFVLSEDDRLDRFNTQSSSHLDALRHMRDADGRRYGDRPPEDLGIDLWSEGIVTRAVLIDVGAGLRLGWDEPARITGEQVDACARTQGVELRPGDALLLRTGWLAGYLALPPDQRPEQVASPGLIAADETIAWLRERRPALIAADNPGVEALPGPPEPELLHTRLIPELGLAVGELWRLDDLSDDCAATGVWEGLLCAVPLNLPGGCGSPANAIVLK